MSVYNTDNSFLFDCSAVLSYDFSCKILKDTDFDVYLVDQLTYEQTLLSLGTDYTITKNRIKDGGTITLKSAHSGYNCYGVRNLAIIQPEEVPTDGDFPEETIETALDRLTLICQQLQSQVGRTPKVEGYSQFEDIGIEDPQDGKSLVYSVVDGKVTIKNSEFNPDEIIAEIENMTKTAEESLQKVLDATAYIQAIYKNMLFYDLLGPTQINVNEKSGILFFEKLGSTTVTVSEKETMLFSEKYNDDEVTIELENGITEVVIG